MSIKVEDYLIKLEDEIGSRRTFHDGSTMLFADNLKKRECFSGCSRNELEVAELPSGLRLYLKRFYNDDETSKGCISNEVVFSRLYNALGVNAVKYYPLILNGQSENENYGKDVAIASQDLNMVTGLNIDYFRTQHNFYRYIREYTYKLAKLIENQDKFYDKCQSGDELVKSRMLLANFIKTGLLDIMCMMIDNHLGNKCVVKRNGARTAEDIISFDLEDSAIDNFNNCTYEDFKCQLENDTKMFSGFITIDGKRGTYMNFLYKIKKLIESGNLPIECIELFEKLNSLNFDNLLNSVESETGLIIPSNKKDWYKKLIDINQQTFLQ